MSELIVVGFETKEKADEVLLSLQKMQKEHLVDLEDAAVVYRKADGKVKVKQAYNLVAGGAASSMASGSLWGLLFGLLFYDPLIGWGIGAATGAAVGAASGALTDIGIDDNFIKELGTTLQPENWRPDSRLKNSLERPGGGDL